MFAFSRSSTATRRTRRTGRPLRLELLERRDTPTGLSSVALPALNDFATLASVSLSPSMVRSAYGFNNIDFNGVTGDGAGQTIAIVTAYHHPTVAADLATFSETFGLPNAPSFTQITQGRPSYNATWAGETALDVQWAHAIAPGANIVLIEAQSARLSDMLNAVNIARNIPEVSVVSMSWGADEFFGQSYYDGVFTTPAGHRGVTFVAASGDTGAGSLAWPATSPNVVAVGGTQLNVDADGNYVSETVWSGSTGGTSVFTTDGSAARNVPDVAYAADPGSGFLVFNSTPDARGRSGWFRVGGTSAGAPQWAGLFAIVNQGREAAGQDSLTNARAAIFSASSESFRDVTSGSNGFAAEKGFDLATGRGSPVAERLVQELVNAESSKLDPNFQGPLPEKPASTPTKSNPPKLTRDQIAIALAINSAQVPPIIGVLIPPSAAAQANDKSRDYPEQIAPPALPPIIQVAIPLIGNADLSARGGGDDVAAELTNPPPPSEPKPSEVKPGEPANNNAAPASALPVKRSRTTGTSEIEGIAGESIAEPVMLPTEEEAQSTGILAAALVLLGGVAVTDEQSTKQKSQRRKAR